MRTLSFARRNASLAAVVVLAWTFGLLPRMIAQEIGNRMVPYSDSLKQKAQAGDTDSQVALAVAFLQGNGTSRRYDQAALWFEKAYLNGSGDAAGWLGGMYLAGQGVSPNLAKGADLIEKSRADGSAVGIRYTALMDEKGIGREANMPRALQLYELAAGHLDPVSCDRMGLAYQTGRFRKQDITKAMELYRCGASLGYSWAQLHLGELYASPLEFNDIQHNQSKGPIPWLSEAYEQYSKAAEAGNRVAAFRVAECLRDGKGIQVDVGASQKWFMVSSRQLYGPAQEALADLYQEHPELGRTRVASLVLYKEAIQNGQENASAKAAVLVKKMSASELASAEEQIRIFTDAQRTFSEREQGLTPARATAK